MTQIRDIVDRIVLILTDSGLFVTVRDDYPEDNFVQADLPAAVVFHGDATYRSRHAGSYYVDRSFYIEIYYDFAEDRENISAMEAAEPILEDTVKLLFQKQRLDGLIGVEGTSITNDIGVSYGGYGRFTFLGTRIVLNVEYEVQI